MSNHSIIEHRANYHYFKLEEDYVLICSFGKQYPQCKAAILAILEHWMNDKRAKSQDEHIYMTYPEWIDNMYGLFRRNTIIACLDELVQEKFVVRRPCVRYGKETFEYMLNIRLVQERLKQLEERDEKNCRPNLNASKFKRQAIQKQTRPNLNGSTHPNLNGIEHEHPSKFKRNRDSLSEILSSNIDSKGEGVSHGTCEDYVAAIEAGLHESPTDKVPIVPPGSVTPVTYSQPVYRQGEDNAHPVHYRNRPGAFHPGSDSPASADQSYHQNAQRGYPGAASDQRPRGHDTRQPSHHDQTTFGHHVTQETAQHGVTDATSSLEGETHDTGTLAAARALRPVGDPDAARASASDARRDHTEAGNVEGASRARAVPETAEAQDIAPMAETAAQIRKRVDRRADDLLALYCHLMGDKITRSKENMEVMRELAQLDRTDEEVTLVMRNILDDPDDFLARQLTPRKLATNFTARLRTARGTPVQPPPKPTPPVSHRRNFSEEYREEMLQARRGNV